MKSLRRVVREFVSSTAEDLSNARFGRELCFLFLQRSSESWSRISTGPVPLLCDSAASYGVHTVVLSASSQ